MSTTAGHGADVRGRAPSGARTGRRGPGRPQAPPRSLTDDLRGRGDDELAALLRARPDLATPVPNDLATLAVRAASRASVQRALERLDRFTLQVIDALRVLPEPASPPEVAAILGDPPGAPAALARLRREALVWGTAEAVHLVTTVEQLLGPGPADTGAPLATALAGVSPSRAQEYLADLGLPATADPVSALAELSARQRDPEWMAALLAGAPEQARAALDALAWGPPTGQVRDAGRAVRAANARSGVEWLLARALLAPVDDHSVVLPLEVALHLRGGRLHREVAASPPPTRPAHYDPHDADSAAAGQVLTVLRLVEELAELWEASPPPVLRGGGIGVRELKRLATALDVTEGVAALLAETAYAAGLVATGTEEWLPTPAYDAWLAEPSAGRWVLLAQAWLSTSRVAALVGGRDARNQAIGALGPHLDRATAPEVRAEVLRVLAAESPGDAPRSDDVAAVVEWRRPLYGGSSRRDLVEWTLREAELLGVTGRGALASYARPLVSAPPYEEPAAEPPAAVAAGAGRRRARAGAPGGRGAGAAGDAAALLDAVLPAPVDHVLLQADLTAIAPGPLTAELGRELALLADVESKGGATVYRFSPSSVRRALDAGRTPGGVLELLRGASRTPVPQALEYLVGDTARRHGQIRVGQVAAYVRCEDPAALTELLADRHTGELGLRRIAPTVAVTAVQPAVLLEELRASGHAPVAESPGGEVLIRRRDARRTGPRRPPAPVTAEPPQPVAAALHAIVRAVRGGERAASAAPADLPARPDGIPRTDATATLRLLREAVEQGRALWISYVNAEGQASQWVIEPMEVDGGFVTAFDQAREEVRTFAVHRIAGVATVPDTGE